MNSALGTRSSAPTTSGAASASGVYETVQACASDTAFVEALLDTTPEASWCVALGDALVVRSTAELWAALESATLAPSTRVWREGMEAWATVEELPALSCALGQRRDEAPLQGTPRDLQAPRASTVRWRAGLLPAAAIAVTVAIVAVGSPLASLFREPSDATGHAEIPRTSPMRANATPPNPQRNRSATR